MLAFKIACLLVILYSRSKLTYCYIYLAFAKANLLKPDAARLLTVGPYKYLRNPVYVWSTIMWLGIAGLFTSWWFAAFTTFVVVPIQVYRAHKEARYLRAKFGAKYEEYRDRVLF